MPARLHYNTFGEGKPVIILHGLFGSSRNWYSLAKKLSGSFHVHTVDLRNHGQSEHKNSMNYLEMAEDICVLIESLDLYDVSIIGHSMGGKVAMVTSLKYENLIKKLIKLTYRQLD